MKTLDTLSQDLQKVTADLHQVNARVGLWRFSAIGFVFLCLLVLAWTNSHPFLFSITASLAAFFYSFWLVCTHDMAHQTLTGWQWFDTIFPRLISWPMLWPYSTYAQLHRLHHSWNGINLQDPERVQWTEEEYRQANPLLRWYVRYQWAIDIFLLGGVGLIIKTFTQGMRFQKLMPNLRQQMLLDIAGILTLHSLLLTLAIMQEQVVRYLLFWLILERVIGIVVQTRDHLEHYALWGKHSNHQLTQLYACRNLKTSAFVGWLMGGLNYHAVHHAFPGIPFNQLPEAFARTQTVLQEYGLPPMCLDGGYLSQTYWWLRHPSAIAQPDPADITGRYQMISINQ